LVTGATGFIGLHLVRTLSAAGHELTCLVRRTSRVDGLSGPAIRLVQGDVDSGHGVAGAIAGQDAVFHLAGSIRGLTRDDFFRTNCDGVRQIVEAAAGTPNPPAVVVVSSIAAAGPCEGQRPLRPGDPERPVSCYGESKLAGEREARRLAADVPVTVVRSPIVFGGGDRVSLDWFRCVAKYRLHFVPGFSDARFSLVHVDDLVQLLIAAAERGRRLRAAADDQSDGQGCYYVGADEAPTYGEIGGFVAASLGIHRYGTLRTPITALRLAAVASECWGRMTRKPPFLGLGKVREASAGSWVCSTQSARDELGFSPSKTLRDSFTATAAWYREHGWL
jgi:nucleoside-diphosphate-sugar epimerase